MAKYIFLTIGILTILGVIILFFVSGDNNND